MKEYVGRMSSQLLFNPHVEVSVVSPTTLTLQ